jgi:hypothetical protein
MNKALRKVFFTYRHTNGFGRRPYYADAIMYYACLTGELFATEDGKHFIRFNSYRAAFLGLNYRRSEVLILTEVTNQIMQTKIL